MIRNNKILVFIILLAITLQSCGVISRLTKKSDKNKEDIESSVKKESEDIIIDKSTIVIKEKVDTVIKTLPKEIVTDIKINDLSDFVNLTIIKTELLEIKQTYDKLTKSFKTVAIIRVPNANIKFDRTTTINKNINASKSLKIDSVYNKKSVVKSTIKSKEPINLTWYIIISILAIGTCYYIYKKFPTIKTAFTKLIGI